ncbi:hypothetical protein CVT25_011723 [Psilocybe cyanescens]|uniref:DUF6533 domain-containing protein n=1 Tax=Psilocybe cyanescens TaxID=93625 RepID=A0A409WIB2_PSICY|nr:hypothetical protein CVT25_011723 [Psilocybe cyanescens]
MAEDVTLEELKSMNVNYYFSIIAFTLLVLEYCDTFVQEVERFWKVGSLSWASGFFYLNRYMVLFGHIPVLIEYFWSTSNPHKLQCFTRVCFLTIAPLRSCHQLQSYHQYFAVVVQIVVSSMLIMRMYALYERSRRVLALLIGVAVAAVAVGCWSILGGRKSKLPDILVPIGCGAGLTHYHPSSFPSLILHVFKGLGAAWGGMLVFDALVFGMTLYKSLSIPRTRGVSLISRFTRGVATTFTNVVSSIMISRLMLNLRHPSLVSHTKRTSVMTDNTYPNLTFVGPDNIETGYSDNSGITSEEEPGRARMVYDYLAKGSSGTNRHIELLDRHRDGRHV